MSSEISLQQIAESVTKSVLNANDKDLEGFQKLIDETVKVRESHRNLQRMLKNYSSSMIQRS
ncbi:hypothetical protein JMM81_08610 [Bacillus sp. V3B]|jgi:hypothetical protein|uniref:hypothetical protein n=1 Tax=Bacillus sp. V3B TaxID=2804915 RepID=UPI00210A63AC|nr:hypothetical protein [Bacillus sp. V3B]MCQ6275021.1 hypothetical protein [Bacillus sp. V3B]